MDFRYAHKIYLSKITARAASRIQPRLAGPFPPASLQWEYRSYPTPGRVVGIQQKFDVYHGNHISLIGAGGDGIFTQASRRIIAGLSESLDFPGIKRPGQMPYLFGDRQQGFLYE